LPSPQWRERLLSEIGQAFHRWVDEGTIELLLAALDDPEVQVARRAVGPLLSCLRERSGKERAGIAKTLRGKAAVEASDQAAAGMTPGRRARIAGIVTGALDRHAEDPKALTGPDDYIELLGHCATRGDRRALVRLEGFRRLAGETRRCEAEALDPEGLPVSTSMAAEQEGVTPGTQLVRIWSRPTGLLDLERLEEAIARIRLREG